MGYPQGYQQVPAQQGQVLYQADLNVANTIRYVRDRIQSICNANVGRMVRVQTLDGQVIEGTIVKCEHGLLYLKVSQPSTRSYGTILTLVLYELLVITLLYL